MSNGITKQRKKPSNKFSMKNKTKFSEKSSGFDEIWNYLPHISAYQFRISIAAGYTGRVTFSETNFKDSKTTSHVHYGINNRCRLNKNYSKI